MIIVVLHYIIAYPLMWYVPELIKMLKSLKYLQIFNRKNKQTNEGSQIKARNNRHLQTKNKKTYS